MGGLLGQLKGFVKDVTQNASEALARQQAAMVRGKVAGRAVTDDDGNVLVDAGHTIDEVIIARASAAGKLSQLVVAAGAARMQDLKEAAREQIDKSGAGQEARNYDTIEEYAEARGYVGRYAGVDVTDIRGNVIIATGKKITEDDCRAAREAGLLSALIFAAKQPYTPPPPPPPLPDAMVRGPFEAESETTEAAPAPRRKISLVDPKART